MRRSRSSFELSTVLEKVSALTPRPGRVEGGIAEPLSRSALVSFPGPASVRPPAEPVPPVQGESDSTDPHGWDAIEEPPESSPRTSPLARSQEAVSPLLDPPDFSGTRSPGLRCQRFVEWLSDCLGAHSAFIADEQGLGLAGAVADAESRLAAAGASAAALRTFAATVPGELSSEFVAEVGADPVCQLIGIAVGRKRYVLGLFRPLAVGPDDVQRIRSILRESLGDVLGG